MAKSVFQPLSSVTVKVFDVLGIKETERIINALQEAVSIKRNSLLDSSNDESTFLEVHKLNGIYHELYTKLYEVQCELSDDDHYSPCEANDYDCADCNYPCDQ